MIPAVRWRCAGDALIFPAPWTGSRSPCLLPKSDKFSVDHRSRGFCDTWFCPTPKNALRFSTLPQGEGEVRSVPPHAPARCRFVTDSQLTLAQRDSGAREVPRCRDSIFLRLGARFSG